MNFSRSFGQLTMTLAMIALLGGCAHSPKGWRERTPTLERASNKSVEAVISCVSDYWQSNGAVPNYVPRTTGATISLAVQGLTGPTGEILAMLDVDRTEGGGSFARYYALKSIWSKANANSTNSIAACL